MRNRADRASEAGLTIVEVVVVVAIMAVCVGMAAPSVRDWHRREATKTAINEFGGRLRQERSRAMTESLPHLVLIQEEKIVDGKRSTFALLVRDRDRSYSVTAADDVEQYDLGAYPLDVRQYGPDHTILPMTSSAAGSGSALDGDYKSLLGDYGQKMSDGQSSGDYSDVLAMYEDKAEDWAGSGSPGCSGAGPCLDPSHADYEPHFDPGSSGYDPQAVLDLLNGTYTPPAGTGPVNGATFPISETHGVPAMAFNEKGVPVGLDTRHDWGSGSGAIFVTDGEVVYSAFVLPLGAVSERRYDPATNTWE
jgi:Tfp pilus assembly protein PilE